MSPRVIILALFFAVGLLPQGWNKFDNTPHATLLYVLGGLLILLLFLSWNELGKQRFKAGLASASNWLKIVSLLFPITILIAFAVSPVQNFGWSEVMMLTAGVAIFTIVQTFTEKERRDFLHIVLALAVVCALIGCWQYLTRSESRIAGPMFVAAYKSQYWPNAFALMLLMCWPLALTIKTRIVKILLTGILLTALILTFSRAAFLVLIMQLIIGLWYIRGDLFKETKSTMFNLLLAMLLTVCLTVGLHTMRTHRSESRSSMQTNSFLAKATFTGTEQQTSFDERRDFMKGSLELIKEFPLLGSGPFSFRYRYAKIQPDFLASSEHPHNWYLKVAVEEGMIAFVLFLAFIVLIFYIRRDLLLQRGITTDAILLIAVMGPLAHNVADYNMNFVSNQLLFWVLLGFFMIKKEENPHPQPQPQKLHTLIWPSIVAISTILVGTALLLEGFNSYTKNYGEMKFVRNYFDAQARFVVSQGNTSEGIRLLRYHLSLNPYDAYSWNYLGQIQEYVDREEALKSYANAIKNDPANAFTFYVDYVNLAQKLKKTDTETYKFYTKKVVGFLKTYPQKIRDNIHYTAQTSNPQHAATLAKLLGEQGLALKIQDAIRDFQLKLPPQ